MTAIDVSEDLSGLDTALALVPNRPAVFLLWPKEGDPYLARTALLRRRLLRLLKQRDKPGRLLNLRHTIRRIEYWLTGSNFESAVRMYELARQHFPKTYLDLLKLRMPPYVKIILNNPFPRTQVTTHLTRGSADFFGPFRARSTAELFEAQMLDLFQMRRCQEDLEPSPEHPGCMYGEMGMCLRPCQEVVGPEEYRYEVERVEQFLRTGGQSLVESVGKARDRFSNEMMFEEAARQHKRLEKIQEVLKLSDELARDLDHLHGVAVTASLEPNAVELWPVRGGEWMEARQFSFEIADGKPVSLDRRLRELFAALDQESSTVRRTTRERQEYLALLARWYYSSWREGEWVFFDRFEAPPYRKLVHAISRVGCRIRAPEKRI
jgi:excinuclease UvrABC nuclease subunit